MGYRFQEALLKAYACFTSCMDAGRSGRAQDKPSQEQCGAHPHPSTDEESPKNEEDRSWT
jgi:hypothetical protein